MEIDTLKYPFSMTLYFIPEFITRMRRSGECTDKPSSRQSITMNRLLLPAYLKKGFLSFEDLIDASVLTSRVENQGLAERIAHEILLGTAEKKDAPPSDDQPLMELVSPKKPEDARPNKDKSEAGDEIQTDFDSEVDVLKELSRKPDLGVGPGEDELLKSDVRAIISNVDERYRRKLQEILKNLLLRLGREHEKKLEMAPNPSLRPYEPFEDPDRIDEDRSLENIFEQGKGLDRVRYDDFLMREKENRKRTIIYIQDVSNTMFYTLQGINSIQYSILCLIPLLYALRKEKYGLALYESNSHVMKGLEDDVDEDKLIDFLLSLVNSTTMDVEKRIGGTWGSHTWGGTVPNMSLRWATDQLLEASDRSDKLCFIFSDFVLDDVGAPQPENQETYEAIKRMADNGVRVAACVSPLAHGDLFTKYTRSTLSKIRGLGCEIVETDKPTEFLEKIREFIQAP